MNKRTLLIAVAAVALFGLGALWGQHAWMPSAQAQDAELPDARPPDPPMRPDVAPKIANPAVACTPHTYTTDMEEDPFDAERIRRTKTRVSTVVVVYADGSVSIEKVGR